MLPVVLGFLILLAMKALPAEHRLRGLRLDRDHHVRADRQPRRLRGHFRLGSGESARMSAALKPRPIALAALAIAALVASSSAAEERVVPGPGAAGPAAMARLFDALALGRYAPDDTAPAFDAVTLDGRAVALSQFKGRVVLVTFWATWCLPCKEELPVFDRLYREHASRGLTVLGINVREGAAMVGPFSQALNLTFPLPLDVNGDIARQYGVIGLPTTFVIDRDGHPVGRAIGPRVWDSAPARAVLEALLAQSLTR